MSFDQRDFRIWGRWALIAALLTAAACTTAPRHGGGGGGAPHYKIGQPYKVNGRWYHPAHQPNYNEVGVASWYGRDFHGRKTANGEIYDMNAMTAAHTTLPLPSLVEVENLENRRRIVVRVNDRGPFAHNRVIDLSRAAARRLGFEQDGLARVRVRYLGPAPLPGDGSNRSQIVAQARAIRPPAHRQSAAPVSRTRNFEPPVAAPSQSAERAVITPDFSNTEAPSRIIIEQPTSIATSTATLPETISDTAPVSSAPAASGEGLETLYVIQVAALSSLGNIDMVRADLGDVGPLRIARFDSADGRSLYRVTMGPYTMREDAIGRLEAVREAGYDDAALVAITPQ